MGHCWRLRKRSHDFRCAALVQGSLRCEPRERRDGVLWGQSGWWEEPRNGFLARRNGRTREPSNRERLPLSERGSPPHGLIGFVLRHRLGEGAPVDLPSMRKTALKWWVSPSRCRVHCRDDSRRLCWRAERPLFFVGLPPHRSRTRMAALGRRTMLRYDAGTPRACATTTASAQTSPPPANSGMGADPPIAALEVPRAPPPPSGPLVGPPASRPSARQDAPSRAPSAASGRGRVPPRTSPPRRRAPRCDGRSGPRRCGHRIPR